MPDRFSAELSARYSKEFDEPGWLAERRADACARFASLPWPDQSIEEWRHTDIRALDVDGFDPEVASPWGSDVPDGVVYGPLSQVARTHEDLVRTWLGRAGVSEHDAKFHALNAAFGIACIAYVPPGVTVQEPLVTTRSIVTGGVIMPRTIIVVGEGASLTYIDRYEGGDAGEALAVPVVEIYAEQAAHVDYVSLQDWPQTVWHLGITRALIGRDATVRQLTASLGGRLSRSVVQSVLDGSGAHAEMLGVYFGDHTQHIDNRTLQLHRARNTSSELYYKGALKGSSRAVYSGLVDIEKDAHGSDAQQTNRNLLLSEHASADPSPFLEIKTSEVVRATHAVSVGRPDENVLFYLHSRGLDAASAERLLVTGFFQEIIDRVRVPQVRETLERAVEAELALEG